jgi:hypothetical protein
MVGLYDDEKDMANRGKGFNKNGSVPGGLLADAG